MSHTMMEVIWSIVAMLVGFGVGQIVAWREAKIGGRTFVLPTIHPGEKTPKVAAVLVILVAVVSLVSAVYTQNVARKCDEDFREALIARSDAVTEVIGLISDLQDDLAAAPEGDDGEDERYQARQDFVREMGEIRAYRDAHPFPEIECGE